jgi:Fe-S oxidoreductase
MREWLRQQDVAGGDVLQAAKAMDASRESLLSEPRKLRRSDRGEDFSHEVYDAMAGCLACKSCAGQCPVKVNVPDFRSRFLQLYHQRYRRPLRDYLVGMLETMLPLVARFPRAYNHVTGQQWLRGLTARWIGGRQSRPGWHRSGCRAAEVGRAAGDRAKPVALSGQERERSVVLVQDVFTRYFETSLVADFIELASRLGYRVWLAPQLPNGKPLHVRFPGQVRPRRHRQCTSSVGAGESGCGPGRH